ncbi:hypothetical protein [Labilibaculum euxinus]
MKTIGGEAELQQDKYNTYFTDSGRSSLRLILRSLNLKLVALPDYLCSVITDVFVQEKTQFTYYKINNDLSIETSTIDDNCDAVYIIDYFGINHDYLRELPLVSDKIIIEDNVFSPYIENTLQLKKWISYNSYRKFSACAEGSLIKSNIELNSDLIHNLPAPFINAKYKAKRIKYEYLNRNLYSEENYLHQFKKGEELLDQQKEIFTISPQGFNQIIKFHESLVCENKQRDQNYQILKKWIVPVSFHIPDFKSFFVFSCENIQYIRKKLMNHKIFLARHWPNSYNISSSLYQNLLSIPLDPRYNKKDMERMSKIISKYLY